MLTKRDDGWRGEVVPHPRMEGYWLAMWKPHGPGDCGFKRYKTQRGALRRVARETVGLTLREQLIAAIAKVGVPEAVRRIESIAQAHEDP